jgi:hypothetical protein
MKMMDKKIKTKMRVNNQVTIINRTRWIANNKMVKMMTWMEMKVKEKARMKKRKWSN